MYQTSLHVRLNATAEKAKILELFFQDWADGICNKEVEYETIYGAPDGWLNEIIRVDFKNSEDAVAMKLRGIPQELQNYLTIVDYK
jgi:hypothetical protein